MSSEIDLTYGAAAGSLAWPFDPQWFPQEKSLQERYQSKLLTSPSFIPADKDNSVKRNMLHPRASLRLFFFTGCSRSHHPLYGVVRHGGENVINSLVFPLNYKSIPVSGVAGPQWGRVQSPVCSAAQMPMLAIQKLKRHVGICKSLLQHKAKQDQDTRILN